MNETQEKIDQLLQELQIIGFAVVKEIASLRKEHHGKMACPMCGQKLRFTVSYLNGHCAAKCVREGCIHIIE